MAQLYEPDGTPNIIATIAYCIAYCASHPGWYWSMVDCCG